MDPARLAPAGAGRAGGYVGAGQAGSGRAAALAAGLHALPGRLAWSRLPRRRPTFAAELLLVAAWAAVFVQFGAEALASGRARAPVWWCSASMAGMAMPRAGGIGAVGGIGPAAAAIGSALPMWLLMSCAMMLPAALPAVAHVARNSLCWRRSRAIAEFLFAYLAVWAVYGALASAALAALGRPPGAAAIPVALALATAWQLTRPKLLCLHACHRSSPLPPYGWRASAGVARFALRNGLACVGSCWALMLIMALAAGAQLLWMPALTALVCAEKLSKRPLRATRRTAYLLGVAALCGGLLAAQPA